MALAARPTDKELEKGRVEKTTVRRYWPGRAPNWAKQQAAAGAAAQDAASADAVAQQVQRTAISAPVVVKRVADPRLARLAARSGDREEAVEEHRQIRAAEIVRRRHPQQQRGSDDEAASSEEEDEASGDEEQQQQQQEEEDEQELQRRRDALRERLRQQQQQEQELLAAGGDEGGEDESSEYTTDDEDSDDDGGPARGKLVKPVFVRKGERETIAAREAAEAAEAAAEEEKRKRLTERQQETRQLLVATIAADEAAARAAAGPPSAMVKPGTEAAEDVDTGDEAEPDAIDAWQRREAARIKRDHGEREAAEAERLEREKLKAMSEEERLAYLKANRPQDGAACAGSSKSKWRFMQKYWHKGAFFQSNADDVRGTAGTDAIFGRDFSAPTGEDNFDKAALPAVMQVKNFGRAGRTKWTHLLNEDTSVARRDDEWYKRDEQRPAGAVTGGYSRDTSALRPGGEANPYGGAAKRSSELLSEGFVKPKKFKT